MSVSLMNNAVENIKMESSSPSSLNNMLNQNNSPSVSSNYYNIHGVSPSEANTASNGPYNTSALTPNGSASENIPPHIKHEVDNGDCRSQFYNHNGMDNNMMSYHHQMQMNNHNNYMSNPYMPPPLQIRNPFEEGVPIPQYASYPPMSSNFQMYPSLISIKQKMFFPQNHPQAIAALRNCPPVNCVPCKPVVYPTSSMGPNIGMMHGSNQPMPSPNYPIPPQQIRSSFNQFPGNIPRQMILPHSGPQGYSSPRFQMPSPSPNFPGPHSVPSQFPAPSSMGPPSNSSAMGPPSTPPVFDNRIPQNFRPPGSCPPMTGNLGCESMSINLKRCEEKCSETGFCHECKGELSCEDKGIRCTALNQGCNYYYHQRCSSMELPVFNMMLEDPSFEWICHSCYSKAQNITYSI
uniref:PHD-type domain-containing protein n=1 Tax=Parastrongyloides trichosuri TaxID=131310 RepID=A0A0N4ZSD6_PARTI